MKNNKSTLKILPIKPSTDMQPLKRPINPILPDLSTGQTGLFVGKIKSGKSVLLSNLLLRDEFYAGLFDTIYIISNSINNDESSRFLREEPNVITYDKYSDKIINDIIETQSEFTKKDQPQIAVFADDIVGSCPINAKLFQLFTRSRHYNILNLCVLTQAYKAVPPVVRANITYLIVFWNLYSEVELEKINMDYGHFVNNQFVELYKEHIQKDPYAFMYINFNTGQTWKNFQILLHDNLANTPKTEN